MPKAIIRTAQAVLVQEFEPGDLLADVILAAGILFDRPCAGRGTCGKCRMQVRGALSEPTPAELENLTPEELAQGIRLTCQTRAKGDVEVIAAPGAVITDKIFQAVVDLSAFDGEPGLAIDLGSTTVAAFLADLEAAKPLAGYAVLNRQAAHGAEVISRLALAERDPQALSRLAQASIQEAVTGLRLPPALFRRIRRAVVVGNTAMHHLLLGLPVSSLVQRPFSPAAKEARSGPGSLLGNGFPTGWQVRFPPLIGGFVGSDALACLLYFGFDHAREPLAALDLGTNGEVLLTDGRRIAAASTAAGPAFEGVNIGCGMRALPGAIVRAASDGGAIQLETLENAPAQGIAGSGLISLARVLRDLGWIENNGRIVGARHALPLQLEGEGRERKLWLTDKVYLTQHDIRELQKAKAAVRAALDILLQKLSLKPGDLRRVILTGSFGGRVPVEDALALGLLPEVDPVRVASIPNGAGLGAALMLREDNFARAQELALRVEHVELNLDPQFQERFIEAMTLAPG
jgi:uncharacterized 2Fe-2S/4Fe-4S cluster protein (DUF4445 family)